MFFNKGKLRKQDKIDIHKRQISSDKKSFSIQEKYLVRLSL